VFNVIKTNVNSIRSEKGKINSKMIETCEQSQRMEAIIFDDLMANFSEFDLMAEKMKHLHTNLKQEYTTRMAGFSLFCFNLDVVSFDLLFTFLVCMGCKITVASWLHSNKINRDSLLRFSLCDSHFAL
jgi:hypothetical protein